MVQSLSIKIGMDVLKFALTNSKCIRRLIWNPTLKDPMNKLIYSRIFNIYFYKKKIINQNMSRNAFSLISITNNKK